MPVVPSRFRPNLPRPKTSSPCFRRWIRALVGGIITGTAVLAAPAQAWDPAQATTAFERAPCPAPIPKHERATCGMVTLPADPTNPGGAHIRLQVAVLHAWRATPAPAPDPVLFLDGGPGDMTLGPADTHDTLSYWMAQTRRLRLDRDVIVFDGRGIGGSWPSLECPEAEVLVDDDSILPGDLTEARRRDAAAHLACEARLRDGGVNLSLVNSPVLATDALALVTALGVDRFNLWAVSYGTRIALEVLRQTPERIRAAVLDGVYPPTVAGMTTDRARFTAALDRVFTGCRAQKACAEAFPDLEATFHRTLRRYAAAPYHYPMRDGPALVVDDRAIIIALLRAFYDHEAIPHIPSLLTSLSKGNKNVLEALASWPELLADANAAEAVYLQMSCTEDWALSDPKAVQSDHKAFPWADAVAMPLVSTICPDWLAGQPAAPWVRHRPAPVTADVPTLLLSGAFDVATPAAWAEEALRTLPHGRHAVLRDGGHAVSFDHPCGEWAVVSFLRRPQAPLPRCLNTTPEPVYRTGFPDLDHFWM